MNRVEGDLEVSVEIQDGVVTDAWSSGMMYRGFENLLKGRAPLDGLVLTPRICGICGTAHLLAAARALEMMMDIQAPPAAVRLRDVSLKVEKIQSDMRHGFLMFAPDFVNPVYAHMPLYQTAVNRFTPFKGETVIETIRETQKLVEIIAIIGGQWPHSSYMIPGGVTAMPSSGDLLQCQYILRRFREWYEKRVIGCRLDRWLAVQRLSDLDAWLDEHESHRNSEIGFFIRFGREIGLDAIGRGHGNFISFGVSDSEKGVLEDNNGPGFLTSGFSRGIQREAFSQRYIIEDVSHSWYSDEGSPIHPFHGETRPYATGQESRKYSWAKAPRYKGLPAETGPLAQMIVSSIPLFTDMAGRSGPNAFVRELARLVRPVYLLPVVEKCLSETLEDQVFYAAAKEIMDGQGVGLADATRGGLGHWVTIKNGKIAKYQVITPTTWNASPRDMDEVRGPWEEALIGTPVKDHSNPVELGHVIRSFDACLFCTVHTIKL
jgi:hydrogenase large subunit